MNTKSLTVDAVLLKLFNEKEEDYFGSYENLLNIFDYGKDPYDEPKLYHEQGYINTETKIIDIVEDVFMQACTEKNINYLNFILCCANINVHMKNNSLFKMCLEDDNAAVFQYMLNHMGFKMDKQCFDYMSSQKIKENSNCKKMIDSFLLKEKLEMNEEKKDIIKSKNNKI